MSSQETVYSSNEENFTDAIRNVLVINCAVNLPLALTAIIGNTLVLHAVYKTPALRSPSMILLCGLALSDLAVGSVVQPLFITNDLIGLYSQSQKLKDVFKNVYNIFGFSLCGISLCTITAISVDRLIAVQKTLQYSSIVTIPRVTRILLVIWTSCVILASAHFWQQMVQLVAIVVVICACLCISAYSHVKIYKTVRHHQNAIQSQFQAVETNSGNCNTMSTLKNSAFNAFLLFLVLVFCYFPYFVAFVVTSVNPFNVFLSRSLTSTIVFINSALNPFLYCWRLREIREVVKQTCRELVCRK
ncbi:melanocyte-stimulating hormone receptor-like [Oculina patagonica]